MAVATITVLPILAFQRQFVQGIASTGIRCARAAR